MGPAIQSPKAVVGEGVGYAGNPLSWSHPLVGWGEEVQNTSLQKGELNSFCLVLLTFQEVPLGEGWLRGRAGITSRWDGGPGVWRGWR